MKISAAALLLAVLTLVGSGCEGSEAKPVSSEGLPDSVAKTRSAILAAAESDKYEPLRDIINPANFLSDFGFGEEPDPAGRWEKMGQKPLDTMGTLLRMRHAVRETNEGTLYEWPRFNADSSAGDVSADEREALLTVMTEDELTNAFLPEYGYTGPHLGIVADGNWWFFVLERGP
jgi:hypothetical protein